MRLSQIFAVILWSIIIISCDVNAQSSPQSNNTKGKTMQKNEKNFPVNKSDADWRKTLSSEEYSILRQKGTERAFTGKYWNHKEKGLYVCAGCGNELFESDTKYNSGCGWPSYYESLREDNIVIQVDKSHGMVRDEVLCGSCGGHLGHVFNDGPPPTGLRYCINSASLDFVPASERTKQ